VNKQHILDEIKLTAEANGGAPLGQRRFYQDIGIKITDCDGKYWARWAIHCKKLDSNPIRCKGAYAGDLLIERFIDLIREIGRFLVRGELKLKARIDRLSRATMLSGGWARSGNWLIESSSIVRPKSVSTTLSHDVSQSPKCSQKLLRLRKSH
jgi:hypothetical protein